MNWYFEKEGVSQGPVLEHDLAGRVQRGEVPADTLVWHDGLTEWQPVAQVSPDWLKPKAPAPQARPAGKAASTTRPLAPSKQVGQPAEDGEPKQGFLSRLFGMGRKR